MIELRDLSRHNRRVVIGQVDYAGAEIQARAMHQPRHEHQGGCDGFGCGGKMLPHPNLLKAQAIREQGFLRILCQGFMHGALRRMERHHEKAKMHRALPQFILGDESRHFNPKPKASLCQR